MFIFSAPPTLKIPLDMEDLIVKAGEPVEVSLDISGSPAPTVEWSKPGLTLTADERTQMVTMPRSATLLITHTNRDDSNDYTVNISNKHGTESGKFKITVIGTYLRFLLLGSILEIKYYFFFANYLS